MFSGIITAEEGDRIRDKGSVRIQMLLETFLNMSLRSACFIDEGFLLVKSKTPCLGTTLLNAELLDVRLNKFCWTINAVSKALQKQ